jgi:hypothetical protein
MPKEMPTDIRRWLFRTIASVLFVCATLVLREPQAAAQVHFGFCGEDEIWACGYTYYGFPYCAQESTCIEFTAEEMYAECQCSEIPGQCWLATVSGC